MLFFILEARDLSLISAWLSGAAQNTMHVKYHLNVLRLFEK